MKILANSQDKAVGGIVRMMNTFIESVLVADPSVSFHFAIASSDKSLGINERRKYEKIYYGFPADCLVTSSDYFLHILNNSNSLEDLRIKMSDLIDFYLESIEKSKPEVVLINGTYYRPWALLQAVRQKNIPYVVYVHGSVTRESQGLSDHISSLLIEMEKDFYAKNVDYIFPSIVALKGMSFLDNEANDNFHVIYNSLDQAFFTPKEIQGKKTYTIGFVLRWENVKNTDFILDFIKLNKNSTEPYRIKIVSDIDADKASIYKDDFTEFISPKTKEEMIEFYKEVDVIINPSFFETFGYVPAEAVASGTPAMVSLSQGVSEIFLKCGLERLISDFDNITEIYKKIPEISKWGIRPEEINKLRIELDPICLSKRILAVLSEATEKRKHL